MSLGSLIVSRSHHEGLSESCHATKQKASLALFVCSVFEARNVVVSLLVSSVIGKSDCSAIQRDDFDVLTVPAGGLPPRSPRAARALSQARLSRRPADRRGRRVHGRLAQTITRRSKADRHVCLERHVSLINGCVRRIDGKPAHRRETSGIRPSDGATTATTRGSLAHTWAHH